MRVLIVSDGDTERENLRGLLENRVSQAVIETVTSYSAAEARLSVIDFDLIVGTIPQDSPDEIARLSAIQKSRPGVIVALLQAETAFEAMLQALLPTSEARATIEHTSQSQKAAAEIDQARQALQEAQALLAQRVKELDRRAVEMNHFTEMINLLQVCTDIQEAYAVISQSVRQLFQDLAGVWMVFKAEQNQWSIRGSWRQPALASADFTMDDCWALRLGRPYFCADTRVGPVCEHVGAPFPPSYLCIPVVAQGKVIGLLHLQTTAADQVITIAQRQLASAVAEQISLGLSNLKLRENLREQAIHDELTGLYNYLFMEESLEVELHRAERSGQPVSIMMFDLDHFKEFNTLFGHPRVNQFLRDFGRLLRSCIRQGDIACRYGGDEFLVILPETSQDVACRRAEQLRQQISGLTIRNNGLERRVTVSIGVASWPENGHTVEELIQAVDVAVYQAKVHKDCVVVAGKSMAEE